IDAVPTDGLGITSSDLEQIGAATYGQVDSTLQAWLAARPENLQNNAVIQRHRGSEFKRHLPIMVQRQQIGLD
ncbi:MAG: hypothetical protein JW795_19865, partial [Chitinivibrionales bacterium]|nr:hypothetical protein [Chitinivibrionales bacterium]